MKKYYIPEIEDFYAGFEFEIQNIENAQWGKCICTPGFGAFDSDIDDLEEERIRVKYLDKNDIESLGFKHINKDSFESNDDNYLSLEYFEEGKGWYLIYSENESQFSFAGWIKNKSELKKLLKQLNIKQ